jgi:hypothetical protein
MHDFARQRAACDDQSARMFAAGGKFSLAIDFENGRGIVVQN